MLGFMDSVLKSNDKNLSSESVLLISSKKSRVELSKSLTMQHFRSTVACDVYVISVSSENLSHDTGGALNKIAAHRKTNKRGCKRVYYSVDDARSQSALKKHHIRMGKSKYLNLKASVVHYRFE